MMETLKFLLLENLYLLIPAGLLVTAGLLVHFVLRKRFELFLTRSRAKLFSRLRDSAASTVKLSLLSLTLIFLVLTLGRPVMVKPNYHQNFMVLMDSSRSMSVEDYQLDSKPCSRLKMAQTALKKLLEELPPESHFGLATFVGHIWTSSVNLIRTFPQTVGSSREELKQLIDWISWSQASTNGTPIQLAVTAIIDYIKEHPELVADNLTVILITDGEENVPPSVPAIPEDYYPHRKNDEKKNSPEYRNASANEKNAKESGLKFIVIGIGTPSGGPIPKFDENWNFTGYEQDYNKGGIKISRRDDEFLTELAQKLGAEYLKIDDPDDLKVLASNPEYKTAVSEVQKDLSLYTILAALLFFLAALVL